MSIRRVCWYGWYGGVWLYNGICDNLDKDIDYTDRSKPKSLTDIKYYQMKAGINYLIF